ncbi:MAG: DNA-processing protein DprA [Bilifractor sp.]
MKNGQNIRYLIWLTQIRGVGVVGCNHLLHVFGNAWSVYAACPSDLRQVPGLGEKMTTAISTSRSLEKADRILAECCAEGIGIVTYKDPLIRKMQSFLKEKTPILLYYRGNLPSDERFHSVGIVGARRCTQADKVKTAEITDRYVKKGYTIISGMAKGVDSYAQTACLNEGGYTIGVLGNGLDICYPKEHNILMDCISRQGLLLSEYPPGTRPAAYMFPARNRIIAALSDKLIVIAPGRNSGAMITAKWAERMGKEVLFI